MKQAILLLPLTALMRAVATGWLRMSFADMTLSMRLYVVFGCLRFGMLCLESWPAEGLGSRL